MNTFYNMKRIRYWIQQIQILRLFWGILYVYQTWTHSNIPFGRYRVPSHTHTYIIIKNLRIQNTLKHINTSKSQSRTFLFIRFSLLYVCSGNKYKYGSVSGKYTSNFHFVLHIYSRRCIFLGSNFRNEILMDLQVLRCPEFENRIFSGWSVCVCVCL